MDGPDTSEPPRQPPPPQSTPGAAPEPSAAERTMRTCPNCGAELAERKCKLYCPRPGCGYYLSCSDFY
jgi:ribosomal protein S27AE